MDKDKMVANGLPNVEISEEVAKGTYSNLAVISHSPSEFIVDFALMLPGLKAPSVRSRIVLTPEHAKRLLVALEDNVEKYEKQFGKIVMEKGGQNTPSSMLGDA